MKILLHTDLDVYKLAFEADMEFFALSKDFPKNEKHSLTDQILRSSLSVCSDPCETFRKNKYIKPVVFN
jgi:four helix bundle protein